MNQEQISALVDNELSEAAVESVLATLRQADGHTAWDAYHLIGDVMRSDEMAHAFSPDFTARMKARLDAEPAIVAPMPISSPVEQPTLAVGGVVARRANASFKRFAIPTAAAAVAAIALIASPQLMVAMKGGGRLDTMAPIMVVSRADPAAPDATEASMPTQNMRAVATVQDGVILRDPRIDEYLQAHQRFSPSLYSTAHYARSATLASESDK
jgi:sigma-E factor negative regulatory protein RseA